MGQLQLGFNDSMQKAGSDRIKISANSAIQFISNSQIGPKKYRSGQFYSFYIQYKFRSLEGRLRQIPITQ